MQFHKFDQLKIFANSWRNLHLNSTISLEFDTMSKNNWGVCISTLPNTSANPCDVPTAIRLETT